MTKTGLLELIRAEHASLETLLADLDDDRVGQPGVAGEWSVKDIAAHLAFWEQWVADELKSAAAGRTPVAIPSDEIQRLNERNYQNNRHRTLAEIRPNLQRSMRAMLENVTALSEDMLARTCTWTEEGTLARHVANEMGHWQDHLAEMRAWLSGES